MNEKNAKTTKRAHAFKNYASAFKDYASSHNVKFVNSFNPELQLKDIESTIESKLIELLTQLKGFKFVTTLVLMFKKIESKDKIKYENFYSSSKAEMIINDNGIDGAFKSIFATIIENIQKSLGRGCSWIIDSVINHTISISKYNPISGSSCIKLLKELDHPRKGLINIQNINHN